MGRRDLKRLKYLHAFTDRHGKARYYFRRNGKRAPLPGSLGSKEFMEAYSACLAEQPAKSIRRPAAGPGTFAALAINYFGSPAYRDLAASSKANYRRVIDGFLQEHGHRRVDQIRREHIDAIIGKMANKTGAGIVLLKRIRTLVRYAITIKWLRHDPTLGATSYRSKEFHRLKRNWHNSRPIGRKGLASGWPMPFCSIPASAAPTCTVCPTRTSTI
jgi:hypothetical protein